MNKLETLKNIAIELSHEFDSLWDTPISLISQNRIQRIVRKQQELKKWTEKNSCEDVSPNPARTLEMCYNLLKQTYPTFDDWEQAKEIREVLNNIK